MILLNTLLLNMLTRPKTSAILKIFSNKSEKFRVNFQGFCQRSNIVGNNKSSNKGQVKYADKFYASDIQITRTTSPIPKPDYSKPLQFGLHHTDHLLEIDYDPTNGWSKPVISPYHKFLIDPTNSSLHYAIQLFEGMKAFRNIKKEGQIMLFRPEMNMKRMRISAKRIGLPVKNDFPGEELIKCLEEFIKLDKDWVPDIRGYSLYIRPTYISMTNQLGVFPAREAKIFALLSPVGPYFPTGFSAIKIICSENIHRSWPGGFGYAKLGANYGPTLEYFKEIKKQGFQHILWLINDRVTEVGVMNFFVYWINKNGEKEVITCPLDGTILPGVVRDSVIQLCKDWNIKIKEEHYTIHDIVDAIKEKRLLEAFGTGTAAIICPIKEISYKGVSYQLFNDPNQNIGEFGKRFYDYLLDIQTGVIEHPWTKIIE